MPGRALLRHQSISLLKRRPMEMFRALDNVPFEVRLGESLAVVGVQWGWQEYSAAPRDRYRSARDRTASRFEGAIAALMELGAGFHPDLSGAENLVLNASLLGFRAKRPTRSSTPSSSSPGSANFIEEPLRTYSSGMMLRLAFAVAVRVNPDILFIDEMLAVGDQQFQSKCVDEIKRLKRDGQNADLRIPRHHGRAGAMRSWRCGWSTARSKCSARSTLSSIAYEDHSARQETRTR